MDGAVSRALQGLASGVAAERCRAASELASALRERQLDATPAVAELARALGDESIRVAQEAATTLRTIAQYRRGSIAEAVGDLARVVSGEDQELRKRAGEALVEGAENGPGIATAVPALEAALTHRMKHVRNLAASALAAHLVDAQDAASLERLVTAHPRVDVQERALGSLARGAEWKDISFAVPLLCRLVQKGDTGRRRRAAHVLEAYLRGPVGVRIPPESLKRCAGEIARCLDGIEERDLPGAGELREGVARALRAAIGPDDLKALVADLASTDVPRRAEAAYSLQLASNAGVAIDAAVAALRTLVDEAETEGAHAAVFALVKHHLDRGAWASVRELLSHPAASVRREALFRVDLAATRSSASFTPLAGIVGELLADADASVRERAANVLRTFTMLGSAADRTDIGDARQRLAQAAASGEPGLSETAGQALQFGAVFGNLASAREQRNREPGDRCMHGSPRDPVTGEFVCGRC